MIVTSAGRTKVDRNSAEDELADRGTFKRANAISGHGRADDVAADVQDGDDQRVLREVPDRDDLGDLAVVGEGRVRREKLGVVV